MIKLRIENLKDFLEIEFNNTFKILHELEETVKNNKLEKVLLIPYKENGDVIFDLTGIVLDNNYLNGEDFIDMDFDKLDLNNFKDVILSYQYSTTIS
jgi:uncharacterized protein YjbI with pentapeptide repeats